MATVRGVFFENTPVRRWSEALGDAEAMALGWENAVDVGFMTAMAAFSLFVVSHVAAMWIWRHDFLIAVRCETTPYLGGGCRNGITGSVRPSLLCSVRCHPCVHVRVVSDQTG